jgi:hypothetical protein
MPKARSISNEADWARLGAGVRLQEIRAEQAEILAAYPELARGQSARVLSAGVSLRKKRTFSPEAKKRMAEGMRKYWAKRKTKAAAKTARVKA